MVEDRRYSHESILVHEFAHAVMDLGLWGQPLRVRDTHAGGMRGAGGGGGRGGVAAPRSAAPA